ncbi:hypothetical protein ZWY2020_045324 [Hordeum vulgare]|nr:hypothetical protein ZWY2020_045324 [Hordeum vulgare]
MYRTRAIDPHVFVRAPRSPLGIGRRSLDSFFPEAAAGFFDRAKTLGARRGLLLLSLDGWISAGPIHVHLAVCNPLHGTCNVLPPLMSNKCALVLACHAILTGADLSPKRKPSRRRQGTRPCSKCSSSAPTQTRREARTAPPLTLISTCSRCGGRHNNGVVVGGMAYWLFRGTSDYYILQVSVDTGHVSSAKLSIPIDAFLFAPPWLNIATGGKISLVDLPQGNQVENWTCRDGGSTTEWRCTRMIDLGRLKMKHDHGARVLWMGERCGRLILDDYLCNIHIADLGTGATQDITPEFGGLASATSVPFEVDWTAFFSSRLGGQK